jgi:hypothetical protein
VLSKGVSVSQALKASKEFTALVKTIWLRRASWILGSVLTLVLCLLRWGGYWLVADGPLPDHLDGAVVLQGSILGEKARLAGAVQLLQQDRASRMLLSVPRESYWGQSVAPIAHNYIDKLYGHEIASRVDYCETGPDVNSTRQEAGALAGCIREHGWNSIAVVTSDYHTRRSGIIWRQILRQQDSSIHLWIHGVRDPEFHAAGWWRQRRSAKTWVMESTKLLWTLLER